MSHRPAIVQPTSTLLKPRPTHTERALQLDKPATHAGQSPCPRLEDTFFQLFTQEFFSAKELQTRCHRVPAALVRGAETDITESFSDYELSERMARKLQEQEDEEAAERVQLNEFMSVAIGLSNILAPSPRERNANTEVAVRHWAPHSGYL